MKQISDPVFTPGGFTRDEAFPALKRSDALVGPNLGGKFALPAEFDSTNLASSLVLEGNEVLAMQVDQPVVGTPYTSEGWTVWNYPEGHPQAGQPHKVTGVKAGENYVLLCRPKEVQEQVNQAYGELSIKQMTAEVKGETLSVPEAGQDPGMLTEERLSREIGVERDRDDQMGRSTAVHGLPAGRRKLKAEPTTVSR